MQAYDAQDRIVGPATGTHEQVIQKSAEQLKRERVAKVIIGNIPAVGSRLVINDLVFEVKFSAPKRGKLNLQLVGMLKEQAPSDAEGA